MVETKTIESTPAQKVNSKQEAAPKKETVNILEKVVVETKPVSQTRAEPEKVVEVKAAP